MSGELAGNSWKQNGPLCVVKGRGHPHVTPHTQEAGLMRLSVASLRRMIKGKLHVEFVRQELTSYSGLEVLRRYLRQRELPSRLRAACAATGGDYGGGRLALLVLALLYVGARRASSLCRRRSADRPLLWVGPNPDGPHRGQLAATVHERHTGSARPTQSRPRYRRHRAIAAAAADHRRRWHGRADRRHGRLGVPGLQPAPSQGSQLLSAARPSGSDGPYPAV